ncbi:LysR family transcriptional regulator substrate-binding protein [Paenibacillus sp. URB8-2]|uniref:LysR family transcriptional regulator substrate-binding protein n=1 Tax=Paenibacillus sp. URB8-2 TaxID=2741301 RepID=UPI0015BCA998
MGIGSFYAASTLLLPDAICKFRFRYPLVTVELTEGTSIQIKCSVEDRTLEIGIIASPFDEYDFKVLKHDHTGWRGA